jgi:hypothetical protein
MPLRLSEEQINSSTYIYKKYAIDSLTFYQNQRYYAADVKQYKKMYQALRSNNFEIDITDSRFMIEHAGFWGYNQWNKLFKIILSI